MRKYTLLELVQEVSREIGDKERIGLDEDLRVNDIANICINVLEGICTRRQWEFLRDRIVVPTATPSKTGVTTPDTVVRVNGVKYKVGTQYKELCYLLPEDFLRMTDNNVNNTEPVVVAGGGTIYVANNKAPSYYTSFNEEELVFDSYDSTVSAGIVAANVQIWADIQLDTAGAREAGLPVESWTPDIPARLNSLWLWECIEKCYSSIVRVDNQQATREARRQYVKALDNEPKTQRDESNRSVNLGRQYGH